MSKLLMALKVGSVCGRTIGVSHPPEELATYTREAWDIGFAQGFIWYPHYVLFFPPVSLGSYWVEIYTCDPLRLQPETIRAIAVPFTVPKANRIYISGGDDLGTAISIAQGSYQLLFETRYMSVDDASTLAEFDWYTDEPLESPPDLAPELIRLTFIPKVELPEPKFLRSEPDFNPPANLSLNPFVEIREKACVRLAPPSHVTPAMLEFVTIAEQTLRKFYQSDRLRCWLRGEAILGKPEEPLWVAIYGTPPTPNLKLWQPHLWISIESNGSIALGGVSWGNYGANCLWRLQHTDEGKFLWFDANKCGLIRHDAETLQQLLLILQEEARAHFLLNS